MLKSYVLCSCCRNLLHIFSGIRNGLIILGQHKYKIDTHLSC
ncbi:hypothetical protein GCQ56_19460 [Marinifilum sp. N1E240]|nr:hypothetical protein [Marinifilum sp. N1E240]